ncbi:hypothetical protein ACQ5SK_38455 [Bradyrhizobium japonicum]
MDQLRRHEPCGGAVTNQTKTLSAFSHFADFNQAAFTLARLANPLIDQSRMYTRYEVRFNREQFDSIVDDNNKWYIKQNLPTSAKPGAFRDGSIELKAAWRVLMPSDGIDRSRYYIAKAMVFDPVATTRGGSIVCNERDIALVGLHIVIKTKLRPQWIWSSFEHIDNVPSKIDEPDAKAARIPYSFNSGSPPPGLAPTPAPKMISDDNPPSDNPDPMQVVRLQPIQPDTMQMNQAYWNLPEIKGTVWANYMLIMTQWPSAPGHQVRPTQEDRSRWELVRPWRTRRWKPTSSGTAPAAWNAIRPCQISSAGTSSRSWHSMHTTQRSKCWHPRHSGASQRRYRQGPAPRRHHEKPIRLRRRRGPPSTMTRWCRHWPACFNVSDVWFRIEATKQLEIGHGRQNHDLCRFPEFHGRLLHQGGADPDLSGHGRWWREMTHTTFVTDGKVKGQRVVVVGDPDNSIMIHALRATRRISMQTTRMRGSAGCRSTRILSLLMPISMRSRTGSSGAAWMERLRQFDWRQSGQGRSDKRRSRCAAQAVPADRALNVRMGRAAKRIIGARGGLAIPGSR